MGTLETSKKKVLSFMEAVEDELNTMRQDEDFRNSVKYKLKVLDDEKDKARAYCLDDIFSSVYKDAVPLDDNFKNSHCEDIDTAFTDFMRQRCPNGIEWYVKEGLKKKSPFARKVLEAVTDLVDNVYKDREMAIDDTKAEDLEFNSDDDTTRKLIIIKKDLELPEIASAIRDNVKQTALSEITRAKAEKEKLKQLESELANDVNMNNTAAVDSALESAGVSNVDYKPSLFNAILINKINKLTPKFESGEFDNYDVKDAIKEYGKEVTEKAELSDIAFIEAVEEYTALSMLKALKLESYNKYQLDDLAYDYASAKF